MSDDPKSRLIGFRFPFRTRSRIVREINDELAFHLAMREDEFLAAGMLPEEARHQALSRFGDLADARRYMRHVGTRQATIGRVVDATRGWGRTWRTPCARLPARHSFSSWPR